MWAHQERAQISQNHRISWAGRDWWGSSSPAPGSTQGNLSVELCTGRPNLISNRNQLPDNENLHGPGPRGKKKAKNCVFSRICFAQHLVPALWPHWCQGDNRPWHMEPVRLTTSVSAFPLALSRGTGKKTAISRACSSAEAMNCGAGSAVTRLLPAPSSMSLWYRL